MSAETTMHTLQYGNTPIRYILTYVDRMDLAIHVHPDTTVAVEAPLESEFPEIEKRVRKRAAWIVKQQRQFRRFSVEFPPRKYVSGETHRYLGRQYRLRVFEDDVPIEVVRMDRGFITMYVNSKSPDNVKKVLENHFRKRALNIFTEQVKKWMPRFERFDIEQPQVVVRRMKSRWGSCTAKGKITLNFKLIQVPKKLIDYVIVHELCHTVVHSHNTEFYALLTRILPDWEERREKLNSFEF
ncbi:MAG: M48 family metallopeptidase [Chloroflexi bacterium]|nr:M48 family metallopeptidase [Chloroflexota bacterium]